MSRKTTEWDRKVRQLPNTNINEILPRTRVKDRAGKVITEPMSKEKVERLQRRFS